MVIYKNIFLALHSHFKNVIPFALVAELVDALDSKSSVFGRVGSIPTQGTIKDPDNHKLSGSCCFIACFNLSLHSNVMQSIAIFHTFGL